ncbi:hypothetical protein PGTUg99_001872 [Puccinia graminis f. sp. tritici]|uniref:Uncharacterized protein n=1 Tax=Puccinia graminis f. sp. tritici TaxID=56615 RepID=A0A5B0SDL1_PUCGR|nr:hypothetical protein PGTUg99_001872 [Puccinia graminis f. sp. tritici]
MLERASSTTHLTAMPESRLDKPMQGLVFSKALALPHRLDKDNLRSGRWLSDLLPSSSSSSLADRYSLEENRLKHPFPPELANNLDPTLLSQLSLSPTIGPPCNLRRR